MGGRFSTLSGGGFEARFPNFRTDDVVTTGSSFLALVHRAVIFEPDLPGKMKHNLKSLSMEHENNYTRDLKSARVTLKIGCNHRNNCQAKGEYLSCLFSLIH